MEKKRILILELVCFYLLMILVGSAYILNAKNFGSSLVGLWGLAAIALSVILLAALRIRNESDRWNVARYGSVVFTLLQLPPFACWVMLGEPGFELFGVIYSGVAGALFHALFAGWSALNALLLKEST